MKELDPNMSILEWVEEDIDRGAWAVLETALHSIESGFYARNGMKCLHDLSYQILQNHNVPPPEWVQEIRSILEKYKKDDYEWSEPPTHISSLFPHK